jgi:TldD protein
MKTRRFTELIAIALLSLTPAGVVRAADETLPDSQVLMKALVDEITRSMDLQVEDLEKPYFIQYSADDVIAYQVSASHGAITGFDRERSRRFYSQVRVGSPELDNTNFAGDQGRFYIIGGRGRGGGGGQATLPVDDDYAAIRQAIWWATDQDYKDAVETLSKKRAYMRDKNIEDRPNDFSEAAPVEHIEPTAVLSFDQAAWKENVRRLSAHFKQYEQVQDSSVQLLVGAGNSYVVNSEGAHVRTADFGALMFVTADVQAEDGMRLGGSRSYAGDCTDDFPPIERILADIDTMVEKLTEAMEAPEVEQYTGPVLFDGRAAAQMFQVLLADGVAGEVDPVGTQRRMFAGAENLEKKVGQRILPRSFQVYDDPTVKEADGKALLGHYKYDDEGVPAQRVDIVVDGKLENMCMSRVPTKKLTGTNGHGRRASGASEPGAAVACLFIENKDGLPEAELKAALIEAAKDEGLEYGVRVAAIKSAGLGSSMSEMLSLVMGRGRRGGGGTRLGDPIIAYKVYVEDGREEPFRGCEFGPVEVGDLRRISAAGDTPYVHNYVGIGFGGATPPSTILAPPVLFEELELYKIEQEYDKLPILNAPLAR